MFNNLLHSKKYILANLVILYSLSSQEMRNHSYCLVWGVQTVSKHHCHHQFCPLIACILEFLQLQLMLRPTEAHLPFSTIPGMLFSCLLFLFNKKVINIYIYIYWLLFCFWLCRDFNFSIGHAHHNFYPLQILWEF